VLFSVDSTLTDLVNFINLNYRRGNVAKWVKKIIIIDLQNCTKCAKLNKILYFTLFRAVLVGEFLFNRSKSRYFVYIISLHYVRVRML